MKFLNIATVAAFFIAGISTAYAGTKAGRLELKGSSDFGALLFSDEKAGMNEDKSVGFGCDVEGNYFLADNFSFGAGLGYYSRSFSNSDDIDRESTRFNLLNRGDFYFLTEGTVIPYAGVHIGYSVEKWEVTDVYEVERMSFFYGAQAGVKFFVTENIAVNCELIYSAKSGDETQHGTGDYDYDSDYEETELNLVFGISVFF